MPKRTNDFQRFVYDLETLLASDDVAVEESGMVLDRSTGKKSEVDVVVTISSPARKLVVGIECRDHGRPADATWIDQLYGRLQNLELDRIVAVSKSGFTKNAKKKAKHLGIELEDMNARRFVTGNFPFFSFLQEVHVIKQFNPIFISMKVRFMDERRFNLLSPDDTRRATLHLPDGDAKCELAAFGDAMAIHPAAIELAQKELSGLAPLMRHAPKQAV